MHQIIQRTPNHSLLTMLQQFLHHPGHMNFRFGLCLLLLPALSLPAAITVTNLDVGATHSLLLKSDGSLWGMGSSSQGQLGDGTYNTQTRPEQIVSGGVTAVACGLGNYSLFVKSNVSPKRAP